MPNDHAGNQDHGHNPEKNKNDGFIRSTLKHGEEKVKDAADSAKKQMRDNPWPVVAGIAFGSFLLGCLFGSSRKS